MNEVYKRRLLLISAILVFFILTIVLFIYGVFFYKTPNPYGDQLEIQNLSEYTADQPNNNDSVSFIEHNLFQTVNMNVDPDVKNNSVKDIFIRDGSFSQTFDNQVHTVSFLVDSDTLKQSYSISYQWSDDPSVPVDQWGTNVSCVEQSDMIYEDFGCVDEYSQFLENVDPILEEILPYNDPYYSVNYYRENGISTISVKIMSNNNSTRTREFFQEYKKDSLAWLKSQDLNLDDYIIIFRNFSGDAVETIPRKSN